MSPLLCISNCSTAPTPFCNPSLLSFSFNINAGTSPIPTMTLKLPALLSAESSTQGAVAYIHDYAFTIKRSTPSCSKASPLLWLRVLPNQEIEATD